MLPPPHRRAARVVVLDPAGMVLLASSHDVDDPARRWWYTLGGGIEPGEGPRQAAVREVLEESGIALAPDELLGPVATRRAVLDFAAGDVIQDEEYYLVTVPSAAMATHDAGWTDGERESMDEVCWMAVETLEEVGIEVFPPELPGLVRQLAAGWDGACRRLGESPRSLSSQ